MTEGENKINETQSDTESGLVAALMGTAIQAFFVAICFMVVVELFLEITLGIFEQVIPDLPPGFEGGDSSQSEGTNGSEGRETAGFYRSYKFAIWYGLVFFSLLFQKISSSSGGYPSRPFTSLLQRFWKRIHDNWFKILVGNALGCFIAATIMVALQQASFVRILVDMILSAIHPILYAVAGWFFTTTEINTVENFANWFHENEMKLIFWALYVPAALDDLGIPNIKTVAKNLWFRRFGKKSATQV